MKKNLVLLFMLLSSVIFSKNVEKYMYPVKNRYISTIIGTPPEFRYKIKKFPKVKYYELEHPNNKKIPEIFWYEKNLPYSISAQPGKAPLAFVLPGVGGSYDSGHTVTLRNLLYSEGYHVVCISNPSHPSFLVSASTSGTIGLIKNDVSDLYNIMKKIYQKAEKELDIDGNYLVGYSLGATYSAFLAERDSKESFFNFKRVFLVNPSVNLLDSAIIFDSLVSRTLPNGMKDINKFMDQVEDMLVELPNELNTNNLAENASYFIKKNPDEKIYEILIGLVFRNTVSNIVFTSDVMTKMGKIVPVDKKLTKFSSLTEYYKKANNYGFFEYFNDFLLSYFKREHMNYSLDELLNLSSMESIADYLKKADNVYAVTNENEIILTKHDIDFIKNTFKGRCRIYPYGGHCGNMFYKDNVEYMLKALKNEN